MYVNEIRYNSRRGNFTDFIFDLIIPNTCKKTNVDGIIIANIMIVHIRNITIKSFIVQLPVIGIRKIPNEESMFIDEDSMLNVIKYKQYQESSTNNKSDMDIVKKSFDKFFMAN